MLILLPSLYRCSVLRVFKGTLYLKLHWKERSQNKDLRSHLGIERGTFHTESHAVPTLNNFIAPFIFECSNKLTISKKYILTVNIFTYQANEHAEVNGSFQSRWSSFMGLLLPSRGSWQVCLWLINVLLINTIRIWPG